MFYNSIVGLSIHNIIYSNEDKIRNTNGIKKHTKGRVDTINIITLLHHINVYNSAHVPTYVITVNTCMDMDIII